MGFLAVFAIAAHNGVSVMTAIGRVSSEEVLATPETVLDATRGEAGHIVTTGLATIALAVPALFLGDAAGAELLRPFAAVVAGGTVTATLLAIYILPALYLLIAPRPRRELAVAPAMGQ